MKVTCLECQNEFDVNTLNVEDTVECPYCGIELVYKGKKEEKEVFEVIEEEK